MSDSGSDDSSESSDNASTRDPLLRDLDLTRDPDAPMTQRQLRSRARAPRTIHVPVKRRLVPRHMLKKYKGSYKRVPLCKCGKPSPTASERSERSGRLSLRESRIPRLCLAGREK